MVVVGSYVEGRVWARGMGLELDLRTGMGLGVKSNVRVESVNPSQELNSWVLGRGQGPEQGVRSHAQGCKLGLGLSSRKQKMARVKVTMEVGTDGVAIITIFNPPGNALAIPIIAGLKEMWTEATMRNDVKAIVLTGNGGRFSGGFDINVFQKVHETGDISQMPDVSVDLVVNTMEDGKKPAIASIDGLALGGGLELALGCHARIAAPRAQLGLPELSLGVIPGFGGTQRLLRLIGLSKAVELMMTSKPIMSEEGKKLGLIDAIVPSSELLKVSRQWTLDIAERRKPWMRSLYKTDKIGSLSEAREVLKVAREQVKQTAKKMPQHLACIGVIEEGIIHGGYNGVLKEAKVFKDLVLSDTSKGLVHVPNVTDIELKPRTDKKVAVIGGGLMGSGIATALALSNTIVILKEINSEYLQKGIKAIEANISGLVARKKLPQEKADKALSMVKGTMASGEGNPRTSGEVNMDTLLAAIMGVSDRMERIEGMEVDGEGPYGDEELDEVALFAEFVRNRRGAHGGGHRGRGGRFGPIPLGRGNLGQRPHVQEGYQADQELQCNRIFQLNELSPHKKAAHAIAQLEGYASTWLETKRLQRARNDNLALPDWDELKALMKRFNEKVQERATNKALQFEATN
ncbi:Peroxisomal fatty acid beta-oxidation multifunctional protein AIM1 [Capsicum chinense]|nr:Peroxisomal fatty acid beta-oxidation multifunctional protein AIM1 [Capsicum chinense]